MPLWILLAVALAYANALHGPFVFDDIWTIPEQVYIRRPEHLPALYQLNPARFLVMLSLAVNYWVHGLDVRGYHLVNLALHALNAMLVYRLFTRWWPQPPRAGRRGTIGMLVATLGWTLTPVQTQAVTYITGRSTLLGTAVLLGTLLTYGRARRADGAWGRRAWFGASLLLYAAGMFTKEIAAVAPALLIVWELWGRPAEWTGRRGRAALGTWPYFAILLAAGVYRRFFAHALWTMWLARPIPIQALTMSFATWWYAILAFLPIHLTIDHAVAPASGIADPRVWLGIALWIGAFALAWRLRRRWPQVTMGVGWFFIALQVDAGVIPLEDVIADHRAYLPSIGLWALAGLLWNGLYTALVAAMPAERARRRIAPLTLAVLALFMVGTLVRNTVWADPVRLWEDAARKSPGLARPLSNLSRYYAEAGDDERALEYANRAIKADPTVPASYLNRGVISMRCNRLQDAERDFQTYLGLQQHRAQYWTLARGKLATAQYNLGVVYTRMRRYNDAVAAFTRALTLNPLSRPTLTNLGLVYERLGEFARAREMYGRVVTLDDAELEDWQHLQRVQTMLDLESALLRQARDHPTDVFYSLRLATFYDDLGLLAKAEELYRAALAQAPDEPMAHLLLANLLRRRGEAADALREYRRVLDLAPDNAEALWWAGQVMATQGFPDEGRPLVQRARALDPDAGTPDWRPPRTLRDGRAIKEEPNGAAGAGAVPDPAGA